MNSRREGPAGRVVPRVADLREAESQARTIDIVAATDEDAGHTTGAAGGG